MQSDSFRLSKFLFLLVVICNASTDATPTHRINKRANDESCKSVLDWGDWPLDVALVERLRGEPCTREREILVKSYPDVRCPQPELPAYGSVRYPTVSKVGSLATYSCLYGYKIFNLEHNPMINKKYCNAKGQWSYRRTKLPKCVPVTCEKEYGLIENLDKVTNPDGGMQSGEILPVYKDEVKFVCKPGFKIDGAQTAICGGDGKWSELPKCIPVKKCVSKAYIPNGRVVNSSSVYGGVRKFECTAPSVMEGKSESTCLQNGDWSSPVPKCVNWCPRPKLPSHGRVTHSITDVIGSIATYSCLEGYEIKNGNNTRVCEENLEWSGEVPVCEPVECGNEFDSKIENLYGVVRDEDKSGSYKPEEEVKFMCSPDFVIEGPQSAKCGADGKWSELPKCVPAIQ